MSFPRKHKMTVTFRRRSQSRHVKRSGYQTCCCTQPLPCARGGDLVQPSSDGVSSPSLIAILGRLSESAAPAAKDPAGTGSSPASTGLFHVSSCRAIRKELVRPSSLNQPIHPSLVIQTSTSFLTTKQPMLL
ncbi:hypothetical protein V2G26_003581 [Clonostachys chloroleuca]